MNHRRPSPANLLGSRSAELAAHPGTLTEVSSGAWQQPECVPSGRECQRGLWVPGVLVFVTGSEAQHAARTHFLAALLARVVHRLLRAELIEGPVLAVVANGALT